LFEKILDVIKSPNPKIYITNSPDLSEVEKEAALRDYPESLAGQFRLFMTVGQQFDKQGPLRVQFYDGVLQRAGEASCLFYVAPVSLTAEAAIPKRIDDKHKRYTPLSPSAQS
jgi:hypothetical protein